MVLLEMVMLNAHGDAANAGAGKQKANSDVRNAGTGCVWQRSKC